MKIDPNLAVELQTEYILCHAGAVHLYDGRSSDKQDLARREGLFGEFCRSLDPNKCYISALIPDDADRDVYFQARETARSFGIHMQAVVEKPEHQRAQWESYKVAKSLPDAEPQKATASAPEPITKVKTANADG